MVTQRSSKKSHKRPTKHSSAPGRSDAPRGELTHVDATGRAKMVDVSAKAPTVRQAVARAEVHLQRETLAKIKSNAIAKGDVLAVAQVAGVLAAKRTDELIPLTHPLPLTGVEMEALAAVAAAALTIYDMCKAVDRRMTIERLRLVSKTGGRRGAYYREGEA